MPWQRVFRRVLAALWEASPTPISAASLSETRQAESPVPPSRRAWPSGEFASPIILTVHHSPPRSPYTASLFVTRNTSSNVVIPCSALKMPSSNSVNIPSFTAALRISCVAAPEKLSSRTFEVIVMSS